ncbi:hypothetical protein J7643_12625 [bacterium]|nr:hypothetical protein [bacterium]
MPIQNVPRLMFSALFAGAVIASLGALPASAHTHGDGHAAHQAPQRAALAPKAIATTTLKVDSQQLRLQLLDARAYFKKMHEAHPDHPGIPTHQLRAQGLAKGSKADIKALHVVAPNGQKVEAYLRTESGRQVADLELTTKGRYTFELSAPNGTISRWSHTLEK